MQLVTWLGNQPQLFLLITLLVLILFYFRLRRESFFLTLSSIGAYILSSFLKVVVHQPRPLTSVLTDFSFPSGHVLSFMACFGFLAYIAHKLLLPSFKKTIILFLLLGLIILIGPSRIYLGDHWANDVFASYFLGSIWLAMIIYLYKR